MYNSSVSSKIHLLGAVIDDIRALEFHMLECGDPSLLLQYKQEMKELKEELDEVGLRVIELIEIYVEECNELGVPVLLDYVRVLKELKKSMR
jgi:sugar phosphate isomerase/epimerase